MALGGGMTERARRILSNDAEPLICEPGGSGTIFPLLPGENDYDKASRVVRERESPSFALDVRLSLAAGPRC